MNKLWYVFGLLFLLGGIALMGWLGVYVMLYGGIMAAINNWGVENSAVVWGIISAVFFQIGMIPGAIVSFVGKCMLAWGAKGTAEKRMWSKFGDLSRARSRRLGL